MASPLLYEIVPNFKISFQFFEMIRNLNQKNILQVYYYKIEFILQLEF